jgi:salicylate biosynthesis isochorismate synthase
VARGGEALAMIHQPRDPGPEDGRASSWCYWSRPGLRMTGLGEAAIVRTEGAKRFEEARRAMAEFTVQGAGTHDPLWFGGFAFDPAALASPWTGWPDLAFALPRLLWIDDARGPRLVASWREGDEAATRALFARCASAPRRGCEPQTTSSDRAPVAESAEAWQQRVATARDAIRDGRLDKIVLARLRRIELASPVDLGDLVLELAGRPGRATTYALTSRGSSFVGSSPETLVRLRSGRISTDALAGSAARGRTEAEDRARAEALLASTKDLHEHELVVAALRRGLERAGARVDAATAKRIARFPEALHLHTPLDATARGDSKLLDIAAALHPSPAVCGTPTRAARAQLLREESWRGWYAGAVGWQNGRGEGELVVALRAALLKADAAWCFAGAGIVDDSDPAAELAETEFKFSVLQNLLASRQRAHAA